MNKLTIVTPTYNDAKYISPLVDSIKAQKDRNFEWIIINDGSSKEELLFLKEKIHGINNCKVISQKNKGVSSTRNTGIINVKTEWVIFVDSDDKISNNLVEQFNKISNINDYKLIMINLYYKKKRKIKKKKIKTTFPKFTIPSVSNKIFKTSLLTIRFDSNIRIGEDADFFINYVNLIDDKEIGFLDEYLLYIQRNNSAIRSLSNGAFLDVLYAAKKWESTYDLSLNQNQYIKSFINEHAYIYTYIRVHMVNQKYFRIKYKHQIKNIQTKKSIIRHRYPILWILSIIFILRCQFLLIPIIKIYKFFYVKKR